MSWMLVIASLCQINVSSAAYSNSARIQLVCQKDLAACYMLKSKQDVFVRGMDQKLAECVLERNINY